MWLLDSKTLELKLYHDNDIPPYVILSHVWDKNEVSFQQMNGLRDEVRNHAGYIKIQKCCGQSATDGFEHVWIDTCCIDKTNSTELSEAINSMFNWYRDGTSSIFSITIFHYTYLESCLLCKYVIKVASFETLFHVVLQFLPYFNAVLIRGF
jgi:hypothetical protein